MQWWPVHRGIPNYNYPWAVFYRKGVWQQHGYQVPATWDALLALCAQMKKDGLSPIAFGDKDGWPAMGTFDYLNMRTNVIGTFLLQEITDKSIVDDLDFFPFPAIAVEGTDAIEAPIDGFVMTKRAEKNKAAMDFLSFLGTGAAQDAYAAKDPSNLQTAADANTSTFSPIQKKAASLIAQSKKVSQFFDRDALPAMANNVMIPALQSFLKDGKIDTKNLETQAKTLYAAA